MHIIYFLLFSLIANQITAMDQPEAIKTQPTKNTQRSYNDFPCGAACLDQLIKTYNITINDDYVEKIRQKLHNELPAINKIKTMKSEWAQALAFSPKSTLLAAGYVNGDGKFFDITNLSEIKKVVTEPPHAGCLGCSIMNIMFGSKNNNKNKMIAYKLSNENVVFWNITQFPAINKIATLTKHETNNYQNHVYPIDTIITRRSNDENHRRKELKNLVNRASTLLAKDLRNKKTNISCTTNPTAYHPDNTHLMVDKTGVWNITNISNICLIKKLKMGDAIALHPKGTRIATGSREGTITIWNSKDLSQIELTKSFHAHSGPINSLILHKKGTLISGSGDNTIKLWDVTDLSNINEIQTLSDHTSRVDPVVSNSRGTLLASGSNDATINIYMYIDYLLGKITPQELLILNEAYKTNNFKLDQYKNLNEIINTSKFKSELTYLLKHLSNLKRTKDI